MTKWQASCLAMMGIDQWVTRTPTLTDSKSFCIIVTEDALPLSCEAQRLLIAMLKSIDVEISQVYLTSQLATMPLAKRVWILGRLSVQPDLTMKHIATDSLQDILASPRKKKQIYFQLKQIAA